MYHIVFTSSAAEKLTDSELLALLREAGEIHSAYELTGMLLYLDGNLIQVIEGVKKNVIELFKMICLDARLNNIIKLYEGSIDNRNFLEWTMAFKSSTLAVDSQMPGYRKLNDDLFVNVKVLNPEHRSLRLLKTFYNNNN